MEKEITFHLNAFQMFLFIKGCLTSVSEECSVWEDFINVHHKRMTQEQRDCLWALVYRDIYLPSKDDHVHLHYWDNMMRFLAMFNIRNRVRVLVQHPEYGRLAVSAYMFNGHYWPVNSTTRAIPKEWVVSVFLRANESNHINEYLGLVPTSAYEDISIYQ